ncbi:MAG: hypothetical protein OEX07_08175, partial [Gammaproteobacteria bacterium]|nr:hypothetical protein [Gammaproteobacteria bacterium]
MSKKEFNKYTLTELRTEAADIKFGWINIIFDFLGAPNSPMPGSLNTFLQTMFGQYAINRDYLGAIVGDKVSSKLGGVIAVDNFVSSDKVEKLLAAQAIMISPDLMLVDPALGFDEIRHNYQWA